ncbi:alpha/beta hydrolase [Clostridium polynesiense]|uniref:alpha/beta hydrolase n=1 Tax=Clostridium polynesiense TaxID=1325933 RepID=UPI000693C963|nr:alpha/beta fold hydrolase [Clostridium polynesiense]
MDFQRFKTERNFYSKALDNYRDILIYLPKSYEDSKENKYGVIYIHDGMEAFFPGFSVSGYSMGIIDAMEELFNKGLSEEYLIVGISNTYDRINELSYFDYSFPKLQADIEGKGEKYEKLIIDEIMPFINEKYRTLSDREHTVMIGASMGGLMTFNLAFRNPHKISRIAAVSPSFWVGDNITAELLKGSYDMKSFKIWLDFGENEGDFMSRPIKEIGKELVNKGYSYERDFVIYSDNGASHSERFWNGRMKYILGYLLDFPQDVPGTLKLIELKD